MHSPLQVDPLSLTASVSELPPHSRLPRLDLGIDWGSPTEEFRTSLLQFFAGPRPLKDSEAPKNESLRVDWIRGRLPSRAFLASSLWHVVAIWALLLPIWGFIPTVQPTLAPVQIEFDVYDPPDLPKILLHAEGAKPSPPPKKPDDAAKLPVERGADVYHPRQTIVSIPGHVTHPRQTLIEPDAPPTPPKVVPQLPNIVQWAEKETPKLQIPVSPTASAPRIERHEVQNVAAPEVNAQKTPGPLDIAPSQAIPHPAIPVNPMSATAAPQRKARADSAVAPEIAASQGDPNLRRLIALSATPGPSMPVASVPEGNLAARISMGPDGAKPGAPGGAEHGSSGVNESAGASPAAATSGPAGAGSNAANVAGVAGAGGTGSLPAAVSISGGAGPVGNGGLAPAGSHPGRLVLKPTTPSEPSASVLKGPANVAGFDPSLPPEKILSGKEVYTLHVNLPNLTSASGSWILNFAQLDEDANPPFRPKGTLSGPEPIEKVDPEYPTDMISQHVQGEVVLYAIIRKDGSVDSIQIVRSVEPELDRCAIAALAKWKFRPATRAGVPVDLEAVVHIPFLYRSPREY